MLKQVFLTRICTLTLQAMIIACMQLLGKALLLN